MNHQIHDHHRLRPNASVLLETKELQEQSLQALERIRRTTGLTREVGRETLETLHGQGEQLDRVHDRATTDLEARLEVAGKLQDRFARAKIRFGTKRRAKKELKREQKAAAAAAAASEGQRQPATFKRRGPRVKNQDTLTTANHRKENMVDGQWHELVGSGNNNNKARNGIGSIRSHSPTKQSTAATTVTLSAAFSPHREEPLADEDRSDLEDIANNDARIEGVIDSLGAEVAELLAISKSMNETVRHQTTTLDATESVLDRTRSKTTFLNKRLHLLSK